jgi:RNA polymerase sigma-70 factor (ECF subfamily)
MSSASDEERRAWFRREILPLEASLRAYAYRFRRTSPDAEDLVHETYSKVIGYEQWADVDNPAAFATQILKNIALDVQRRAKIARMETVGDFEGMGLLDEGPDPEVVVLSRDELLTLRGIVMELPDQVRRVFTLRKVYGLPHKEIADRLGLSVSTVEKHLAKGLRICSERLNREAGQPVVSWSGRLWGRKQHRDGNW